jgi:hypothetical protein
MILDFEAGDLSDEDTLEMFSHLISSGLAWTLEGFYGRTAQALIDSGLIAPDGTISTDIDDIGGE